MKQTKKETIRVTALLRTLFPKFFRVSPVYCVVMCAISLIHGLSWAVDLSVRQYFFDAAAGLIDGTTVIKTVLFSFALLALTAILSQVLNGLSNYQISVYGERVHQALRYEINARIRRLSPELFENTETLDDINKADKGAEAALSFVQVLSFLILFYLPYFIYVGWYLFTLKPLFLLTIVIVFIPPAVTQIIRAKVFARLEDASAPQRRAYEYYEKAIADREYFKETRLLGAYGYFMNLFRDSYQLCLKLRIKAEAKTAAFELSMNGLTILGYCGILWMLFSALLRGEITVGAFAAVFANIGMMYGLMREVINMHIGRLSENFGATVNYVRFLKLPERRGEIKERPEGDITFEDVSYTYPGAETAALSHVSFTLRRGETIAVVGENGSGKSTLVRLLTGLYLPSSGAVTYGGTDTRRIDPAALYRNTSGVFQRFQRYQMTLRENLTISQVRREPTGEELDGVCRSAGFDPADPAFTDGYDTMLSREFDGVELSGGQWQRVAIGRGLYRNHDLIILDEPTAAIDPYEESQVYRRFAQLSRDKTAVIVTHRIGSARLADHILVMREGQAVQFGTHEELLREDGEYRRLWNAQEQWYRDDDAESQPQTV